MTSFDISWATIGKLLLVGFGTYVFLPAALILRDWVLRKAIQSFLLTEKLGKDISRCAFLQVLWEEEYSKSSGGGYRDGKHYHLIGDREVDEVEYSKFCVNQSLVHHELRSLRQDIHSKSVFLNWLLKHYKQQDTNPIPIWLEEERKRLCRNSEEKQRPSTSTSN